MVLTCMSCLHMFEGSISWDELGWHGVCPECGSSFDVEVPPGQIVMAFAADDEPDADRERFTDDLRQCRAIKSYYAFDTTEDFIEAWKLMVQEPDSMWYFVLDGTEQIVSGACDEVDAEIFEEHFGIKIY